MSVMCINTITVYTPVKSCVHIIILLAYLVHTSSCVAPHSQSILCISSLSHHLDMASTPNTFHYHKQTSPLGMAHKLCLPPSCTWLWCPCLAHISCMSSTGMRYLLRTRQNTFHPGRVHTPYCWIDRTKWSPLIRFHSAHNLHIPYLLAGNIANRSNRHTRQQLHTSKWGKKRLWMRSYPTNIYIMITKNTVM